jgi:hypothetical protein
MVVALPEVGLLPVTAKVTVVVSVTVPPTVPLVSPGDRVTLEGDPGVQVTEA